MLTQRVPDVTADDVERVLERDFPPDAIVALRKALSAYGAESWEPEVDRVRLAILKLASRDQTRLQTQIVAAKSDYRDVLAYAEYPNWMQLSPSAALSDEDKQRAIDADWAQYQSWLH